MTHRAFSHCLSHTQPCVGSTHLQTGQQTLWHAPAAQLGPEHAKGTHSAPEQPPAQPPPAHAVAGQPAGAHEIGRSGWGTQPLAAHTLPAQQPGSVQSSEQWVPAKQPNPGGQSASCSQRLGGAHSQTAQPFRKKVCSSSPPGQVCGHAGFSPSHETHRLAAQRSSAAQSTYDVHAAGPIEHAAPLSAAAGLHSRNSTWSATAQLAKSRVAAHSESAMEWLIKVWAATPPAWLNPLSRRAGFVALCRD